MQYVLQFAILCNFQKFLKRESFIPSSPSRLSQKHKQPAMFSCSTYMRAVRQQKAEQVIHSIYYNLGWGCAFLLQSSKQHRPTCTAPFHISPAHPPSTPHCHFTYELLPASRRRERMEGGYGKHLSPVRHLLPQMTQSDCRKSRRERSPFTITVHGTGQWTEVSLSAAPQMPPWPQAFNQTSLLSTMKSAVNHPHRQDKEGCQGK